MTQALQRATDAIRTFFSAALTLLLPVDCGGCETPDTRWCAQCASTLERELLPSDAMLRPVNAPMPVFAATEYAGLTREMLLRFKELGRTDLKHPLAAVLQRAVDAARAVNPQAMLWCVPIPSHAGRSGNRGYQHVPLMLHVMQSRPAVNTWLRALSTRRDQVGLGVRQRQRNAHQSFVVPRRMLRSGALANKHVLLIDDIATTGSSLSAAAATLEAAGATVVAAAVVAHTVKLVS
jgi:predicted amidophosphoribosyltransferase